MPYVQGRGWTADPETGAGEQGGFTIPLSLEADGQVRLEIPFAMTLVSYRLVGDDDIVVDIWKDSFANFPPTDADSITGGNEPTLSSATTAEETDLSGWGSVSVAAGDWLIFNTDSVGGGGTYAELAVRYTRA